MSDYVAYKSARRSGPCLCFLDIEDPTAPQHSIFREDEETELTRKLTRKEQTTLKEQSNIQNSPTKRRRKPTGMRTGGRPSDKPRGMIPSSLEKITKTQAPTTETITHSDTESNKSSNSEAAEPSPKRINQKKTPPATTSTSANMAPSTRSSRHLHSTLAKAFGDPIPINTIDESDTRKKPVNFNIDSPSDRIYPSAKPSLKSLIQEMGFLEKSPENKACMNFLEAISPKNKAKQMEIIVR